MIYEDWRQAPGMAVTYLLVNMTDTFISQDCVGIVPIIKAERERNFGNLFSESCF